ncbi:MAG: hypothetical protein ACE5E5_10775 [Phycisphaerae bacterium]
MTSGLTGPVGIAFDLNSSDGNPVPAVSDWGVIVMALFLLVSATLTFVLRLHPSDVDRSTPRGFLSL